jgi:lauroyl/myristoyl acyltransferase
LGPFSQELLIGFGLLSMAVAAVFTRDDGWHCTVNPPIEIERTDDLRADVAAMTRVMASQFERFIAASPVDWHMFQPAWTDAEAEGNGTRPPERPPDARSS